MNEQKSKESWSFYVANISSNIKTIIESLAVIFTSFIAIIQLVGNKDYILVAIIITVIIATLITSGMNLLINKLKEKTGWHEEQLKAYEKEIDEIKRNSNLHILNIQTHLKQIKIDESVNKVIGKSSKKYIEKELEEISNSITTNIDAAKIDIVETRNRMKELMASKNKSN